MDEIMEEINNAFKLISSIPVQGDFVEIMAGARESLRKAFDLAKNIVSEAKNNG